MTCKLIAPYQKSNEIQRIVDTIPSMKVGIKGSFASKNPFNSIVIIQFIHAKHLKFQKLLSHYKTTTTTIKKNKACTSISRRTVRKKLKCILAEKKFESGCLPTCLLKKSNRNNVQNFVQFLHSTTCLKLRHIKIINTMLSQQPLTIPNGINRGDDTPYS